MKEKNIVILISLMFLFVNVTNAQYDAKLNQSNRAWKFGISLKGSYDGTGSSQTVTNGFGYAVGAAFEKQLVYNIFFQPTLSFLYKGYENEFINSFHEEINGYFAEIVANLCMKFGDEFKGRGLVLYVSPYFTYGLFGTSYNTNFASSATAEKEPFKTFGDEYLKSLDIGFQLGVGYDFSHHFGLSAVYYMGLQKFKRGSNSRFSGFQVRLNYFF